MNPLRALAYDRLIAGTERAGLAQIRSRLLADAVGDVLEVGAGTGLNLRHYGPAASTLTLTEPNLPMLRRLQRTAGHAGPATTVLRSSAEDLPFDDATFDTVVCTLVLCSVDDQPRAAREIRRVLKPGGRLLLVEHLRSNDEALARRQDRLNWLGRLVAGCDCNRPTVQTLQYAGFAMEHVVAGELPKAPGFVRPMVVGVAARTEEIRVPQS